MHAAARRKDRPVRAAARRARARQAALLRHGDAARRRRDRAARREPRGPADQDRGQSRSIPAASARPTSSRRPPILGLYDPDRSQTLTNRGEIRPWPAFLGAIRDRRSRRSGRSRARAFASSPNRSARRRWRRRSASCSQRFPSAKWHQWDPLGRDNVTRGRAARVRRAVDTQYRVDQRRRHRVARRRLSRRRAGRPPLRARLRQRGGGPSRPTHEPALRRREHADAHRARAPIIGCRCRPSEIDDVARRLAAAVGALPARATPAPRASPPAPRSGSTPIAKDLQAHRGASLVIAGDGQPAAVHALAHAHERGARQRRPDRRLHRPGRGRAGRSGRSRCADLVADMNAGTCRRCWSSSAATRSTPRRPTSPFADALNKVALRVHLSLYDDETSALCHWHVPEAHFLEAWSDARGYDGTASIVQPLIAPLYGGKSAHELLAAMSDRPERSGYDIVRDYWQAQPRRRARRFRRRLAPLARTTASFRTRRSPRRPVVGDGRRDAAPAPPPAPRGRPRDRLPSRSRRCSTAGSPTTAGCRSCPSRSRSSRGTTPCS